MYTGFPEDGKRTLILHNYIVALLKNDAIRYPQVTIAA
jgi:hypothetical protein